MGDGDPVRGEATQAWILYGKHTKTRGYGHGPVPGGGQLLTSLRAEVGGYVGGMLALDAVLSTASHVTLETNQELGALIDNKALISRIQKWKHHGIACSLAPDHDLLQVAQGVIQKYKMSLAPDHVKSHQDDSREYKDLPWQAKLNCDCDQLAGSSHKCQVCLDTFSKKYDLPTGHIASLEIDGAIITSHVATAIKEASYHSECIQYITERSGWQNRDIYHTIDWMARSTAGKQIYSSGKRLTIFKLEFALLATMSQRHRIERDIDHRCPRCQQFQETLAHVFQCQKASDIRCCALTKAIASIQVQPTCKFVIDILETGISQWSSGGTVYWPGTPPGPTDNIGQLTYQAFQEQQQIGWDQAIRGCWSKKWGQANGLYCISRMDQGDMDTHARWMSSLVKSMWQYGIDQWIGRNEYVYGKTKEDQLQKKNQEVNAQIRRMHQTDRKQVRRHDRHLFDMSATKRMEQTLERKQKWIECVNTAYDAWSAQQATATLITRP